MLIKLLHFPLLLRFEHSFSSVENIKCSELYVEIKERPRLLEKVPFVNHRLRSKLLELDSF